MPDSGNSFRPDAELDRLLRADRAIPRRRAPPRIYSRPGDRREIRAQRRSG